MVAIKFVGVPTRDFVPFNKVPDKETAIKSSCRNLVTFVYPNPKKLGGICIKKANTSYYLPSANVY